ncbi:choline dehydrogenase [Alsobacter soli]|uniref:Choline dehydrogenase n=1 Tax=Alsobacter soli TaxID=2109933 RepID=A0A2T1HRY9_9HYPH|nr:GMC family oxidoreductase N-terminal domain-containing protein [Alsobacter soli]PSC04279.1 choline dehydrogenase [Alsobacter soli]
MIHVAARRGYAGEDVIEADYVIVGAGSAGCVLANRITESGRYSVILLEAGPADRHPWIHVPLGYGKLFVDPRYNWMFSSEPEPELNGRRIAQPRGRVLGGSSSINGLLYVRGQKEDFDRWRQAGLREWGWDKVLPAFRKAEDQERDADAWHGAGGPLAVSDQRTMTPLCDAFIEACKQAGLPRNDDFNGETQEGAGYYQVTARRGWRWSTARGYLRPARRRPNLRVVTGAAATRILFDGQAATGVRFRKDGAEMVAKAGREVLLCAGAFASPQLLQVSGVGPAEWLRDRLGVPLVADLPAVGRRLQDHLQVRLVQRATRKVTVNDVVGSPARSVAAALQWALLGRGPLTYSAGVAGGFFRTGVSPGETPDVQSLFIPFSTDKMGTGLHPFSGFTSSVCQLRPASAGTVLAQSEDMATPPLIQPNYLSAEEDRRCIVAGVKQLRRILRQPALKPWIASELEPPPEMASDDEFLDYIRATAGSIYHPTSTVRMGAPDEPDAALDERLRVRGCGRLRVIDASAMPWVPSGNTNASVIMLAERGADFVLEEAAR